MYSVINERIIMTVEEMNHKMLVQILRNQDVLMIDIIVNGDSSALSLYRIASKQRISTLSLLSDIKESN